MIDWIVIVTKFTDVLKKFFKKMMLRNIARNASFDKKKQVFDSSSFTFATSVSTSVVNSLNQFLNFEILKLIKTLKKKNEKKQKSRKRRAKNDINSIYLREKFKDSSKVFDTFINVVDYVVSSNNSITFSNIDEIINKFVAWVIQSMRVTENSIVYKELFNVAEILITRKTILKMIQKKEYKYMKWWQRLDIELTSNDLLIKKAKNYQKYIKSERKDVNENIKTITKDVNNEFLFLYNFLWTSFLKRLTMLQLCEYKFVDLTSIEAKVNHKKKNFDEN